MNRQPIVETSHLSYAYAREKVLDDINLTINQGEFLGLVGPNGSGKTTLLKIILGLINQYEGEVKLFGQKQKAFRKWSKLGYVSQKAASFNTGFPATVFEVVSTGLYGQKGLFKWINKDDKRKIHRALEQVGMANYKKQLIGKLSGGQQQRVFIARSLVSQPELVIFDEPTVGVDETSVHEFYQLIADMRRIHDLTILLVSHDIGAITAKVDRVACLNQQLHYHGDPHDFRADENRYLAKTYGHRVHRLEHDH